MSDASQNEHDNPQRHTNERHAAQRVSVVDAEGPGNDGILRSFVAQASAASPFGDRTWFDVRSEVEIRVRMRFPRLEWHVLEDVLGEVLVDLIGYWQRLGSSLDGDASRNFNYAVNRGTYTAVTEVRKVFALHRRETSVDWADADSHMTVGDSNSVRRGAFQAMLDPDPTPDETVEDLDDIERARRVLEELPPEEARDFFEHLFTGETERDQAKRMGIGRSPLVRRKQRRWNRLIDRAKKYGLER